MSFLNAEELLLSDTWSDIAEKIWLLKQAKIHTMNISANPGHHVIYYVSYVTDIAKYEA